MKTTYYSVLDATERRRIEKLEWMDELEELALMQEHYFFGVFGALKPEIRESKEEKAAVGEDVSPSILEQTVAGLRRRELTFHAQISDLESK